MKKIDEILQKLKEPNTQDKYTHNRTELPLKGSKDREVMELWHKAYKSAQNLTDKLYTVFRQNLDDIDIENVDFGGFTQRKIYEKVSTPLFTQKELIMLKKIGSFKDLFELNRCGNPSALINRVNRAYTQEVHNIISKKNAQVKIDIPPAKRASSYVEIVHETMERY